MDGSLCGPPGPVAPAKAATTLPDPATLPAGLEARPYQQRIIRRAVDLFRGTATDRQGRQESEVSSVLVESPTGSGKTVMGLSIARWMQQHLGMTVGWAAMRRNLLSQAAAENARGFGVDLKLISMFDKQPPQVDLLENARGGLPTHLGAIAVEWTRPAPDRVHIRLTLPPATRFQFNLPTGYRVTNVERDGTKVSAGSWFEGGIAWQIEAT